MGPETGTFQTFDPGLEGFNSQPYTLHCVEALGLKCPCDAGLEHVWLQLRSMKSAGFSFLR